MKNYKFSSIYLITVIILSWSLVFTSCRKDDDDDEPGNIENQEFYDLMTDWYFWYDLMPEIDPDLYASPYEVLEALRQRPVDRWSYISTKAEFDAYYRDSKFIGYGFGSAWDQDGKLRVSFIFNSTDMYEEGVRRSWIIERINNTTVQPGMNINQMLGANEVGVTNTFLFRIPDGTTREMAVQKKEVFMNTVLHREVIETANGKVGYLVFKNFTQPSFDELDETFAHFATEGIEDLVLDMRYNGGGQTNVANYLSSIIGGEGLKGEPFARYMYNDKQSPERDFTDNFGSDAKRQPPYAGFNRLFTIATRQTASASEMVINGLSPFIDVYIVGDNTYGKPMGMNVFTYRDLYAFVPVTFKIANARDEGDYFDGLPADSPAPDDLSRVFGDPEEESLKEVLNYIETGSFSMVPAKKSFVQVQQPFELMTGIRAEIGAH
jgi:carboxyl-terminal processing protease